MNKQFVTIVFLFSLLLSSFASIGQGTLRGIVNEEATGQTVPFATVFITETSGGTTSDLDGAYTLSLPAGSYTVEYSFIGFASLTVSEVEIVDGEVTILDVTLKEESQMLDEIVVTAKQIRNTETAVLTLQKKSANLLDGISSQAFRRIGDSNAASAIKRVTGVSVQGGKYVFVRGLGDRYTKSILNGMDVPGLDPDRNTLQLDVFPTNLIDNIIVVKSFTPDMPADFTGGVVNLITKDFPDSKTINISGSLSYNPGMHLNENALSYQGSSTDFLGFDNGLRDIPFNPQRTIPRTASNSTSLPVLTSAFNNTWEAQNQSQFLDYSFGFSAGNQIETKKMKIGYNVALNYKNTNTFYDDQEFNTFLKPDFDDDNVIELLANRTQRGQLSSNNVIATGLVGTAVKWDNHKIGLSLMRIQNGESRAGEFVRQTFITSDNTIIRDNLEYTERAITNALLTGKHSFDKGNFEVEWKLAPTFSQIDDKDVRLAQFRDEGGIFSIEPSEGAVPTRIFRGLEETNYASKLDLTKKFQVGEKEAKLKFGGSYVTKTRDFGIQNFEFLTRNGDDINFSGNADEILAPENIWTPESRTGVFVTGNFEPANTYSADQNTIGAYIMNEFPISDKLKAIYGARVENFTHIYTGQNNIGNRIFNNEELINKWSVLPAANFIYSLTDKTNLRASFSRTLARPSFKEVSLAQIYDALSDRTFIGNLDLVPTDINNFDLRWESFQERGQLFAVSAFYKTFNNPIELVAFSEIAPDNITPRNVGNATVAGIELEARKSLDFIDQALSFGANLTFVHSAVELDKSEGGEFESRVRNARPGEVIGETRQMQGQSPYIINTYLNYNLPDQGWEANLSYNVQGKRLAIVGIAQNPDVFEQPFHSLNAKVSRQVGDDQRMRLSLSATNLLNSKVRREYESFGAENQTFAAYSPGTSISLGLSYRL